MRITYNKRTALAITRTLRSQGHGPHTFNRRTNLAKPDASPRERWTRSCIDLSAFGLGHGKQLGCALDFAVPNAESRIRTAKSTCTVHGSGCPNRAFVNLGDGMAISGPELLFVEMGSLMNPAEHLMLGHELCGTFSRCGADPYNGPIVYGVQPATSIDKLSRFISEANRINGLEQARATLRLLNENAWSPTESAVAALMRLPMDDAGYNMGELVLNLTVNTPDRLKQTTDKGARIPDIVIAGTKVGINYDGLVHLDLRSIASAATVAASNPEDPFAQKAVDAAMRDVRNKVVDDIRRNRELAADGFIIYPVVKEDLYEKGGIDRLMLQVIETVERETGHTLSEQRRAATNRDLCDARYRLLLSLLPGRHERNVTIGWFIHGHKVDEGPTVTQDYVIEL